MPPVWPHIAGTYSIRQGRRLRRRRALASAGTICLQNPSLWFAISFGPGAAHPSLASQLHSHPADMFLQRG